MNDDEIADRTKLFDDLINIGYITPRIINSSANAAINPDAKSSIPITLKPPIKPIITVITDIKVIEITSPSNLLCPEQPNEIVLNAIIKGKAVTDKNANKSIQAKDDAPEILNHVYKTIIAMK